jgi:phosphoribosylanthranilate isomerase
MTLVKICGITNLEDGLAAVEAGADLVGFNFHRPSPRYIEPAAAAAIIEHLPESVVSVGVFVNESLEQLEQTASNARVSVLQLHGDESPEYCRQLRASGRHIIKVFNSGSEFSLERIGAYDVPMIMLDAARNDLRGGTGQLGDWRQAREARVLYPTMFLAGGLSPENIGEAIDAVRPFGVDACSALESVPGKKDHVKLRTFVAAVRAVAPQQHDWASED